MNPSDLSIILPEVVLAVYAMGALLFAVYTGKDATATLLTWVTAAVMVVLAMLIAAAPPGARVGFNGLFIDDAFSRFSQVAVLLASALILVMSREYMEARGLLKFEFPVLVALAVLGMLVMVAAGDLMTLYMGLELQSLSLYVIAALRRDNAKSTEAGLKYFVLGALSSGLLLYGASMVYGFSGTTNFGGILQAIHGQHAGIGLLVGLVLVITGLAFKVSAVPFHMWTPDVYEGSPTPVTAFFATAPKLAAMSLLARVLQDAFGGISADWSQVLALLSLLSMFLGAIAAIGQRDIKRLMAYSSIAHMGYALMGLAAGTQQGVEAMLVYMAIYLTMNLGTFAFILGMQRDGQAVTSIGALNGYASREPLRALALLVLMFSLAGVPPLLGFFGKFAVLWAAVNGGLTWLAVGGVIASVIGAFYYIRIVYYMYFGDEVEPLGAPGSPVLLGVLLASAAIMLVGVVNLFGVEGWAAAAAGALVN